MACESATSASTETAEMGKGEDRQGGAVNPDELQGRPTGGRTESRKGVVSLVSAGAFETMSVGERE